MKHWPLLLSVFSLSLLFLACSDDDAPPPDDIDPMVCTQKAFFRGTNVCHDNAAAAAIELEAGNDVIILANFFDLLNQDALDNDAVIYVEYENLDSTLFNSGALCGVAIVAPVAELTCLTLE